MRYAIVSDIHGNLTAWNTVLSDITAHGVDRIICLGDAVGYGPEPAEVLRSVHMHVPLMVLGNHDAVVCGRMSAESFTDRARGMIEWTMRRLSPRAQIFLGSLPLVLKGPGFRCVHGDFSDPGAFNYIFTPEDALTSWKAVDEPLLFCGHSHMPALFVLGVSGTPHQVPTQDFVLEDGKRYLVNVGSVGSPRDGDSRAGYVVYDEESRSIRFRRVAFDFEVFRKAALKAGLNEQDIPLLRDAPSSILETVRADLDFSGGRIQGAAEEINIEGSLRRRISRWRAMAILSAILMAAAGVSVYGLLQANRMKPVSFPAERRAPISTANAAHPDGNLLFPISVTSFPGASFSAAPYRITLGDSRSQSVAGETLDKSGRQCIVLKSGTEKAEILFEVPDIECRRDEKIEVMAKAAFSGDFNGLFQLRISRLRERNDKHGDEIMWIVRDFQNQTGIREGLPDALKGLENRDGWRIARMTTENVPGDTKFLRIALAGRFTGEVKIGGVSVRRK